MTMDYNGTHGTSKTRFDWIQKYGFDLRKEKGGRVGPGIYFWLDGLYAKTLATGWYKQALAENRFSGDADTSGIIIFVTITSEERFILDLESPSMKDSMARLAFEKGIDAFDNRKAKLLYGMFIDEIEKQLNVAFQLILVRVAPPNIMYCKYPIIYLGAPLCLVSRNPKRITINRIESVEEIDNERAI